MDKTCEENVISRVKNKLFETAQYLGKDVLKESVKALHTILSCTECSLWSINHNSTRKGEENRDFISTSLICRELSVSYSFQNETDFVHDLRDGLFCKVISADMTDSPVFSFSKQEALDYGHRSKDFVEKVGLNDFIVFPIFNKSASSVIALLEISYIKCKLDDFVLKHLSSIILPFFAAAFARDSFIQKQSLMYDLIECQRCFKNKDVEILFRNIIYKVLMKACPTQGASFFIWDTYQNRYNLLATTGLEPPVNQISTLLFNHVSELSPVDEFDLNHLGVYYQKGEGRTGNIGKTGKPLITDDIKQEESESQVIGKYREKLKKDAKTAMFIPIIDSLKKDEVIGVIRLVNKKNACNEEIIDFFNDYDVEIMTYAADYLSLIIANYQKEENQYNFIDKLTHEIKTPANAIWKSANRLYTHLADKEFISKYLSPYLKNIIDFSELQRWQASTNLYLSKNRRKQPFEVRYSIKPIFLHEVIEKSIDIVIPIARKHKVKFDNIKIDPFCDTKLIINIDKDAFVTVFCNLFTNAIKYHDPDNQEPFYISISYTIDENNLVVEVADNGIGVKQKEKKCIFETGYRSESAIRIEASGYGIGLTVIKQIIEDFGGDICVTNYKKPTVFQIKIPTSKIKSI